MTERKIANGQFYRQQYADLLGVSLEKLNKRELFIIDELTRKMHGGFRFIDKRRSNFNCVWYVMHSFFPEEFSYERSLNPKYWFNQNPEGKMRYLSEYKTDNFEKLKEDVNFKAGCVIALVRKENLSSGLRDNDNSGVRHVALVKTLPDGSLAFESKLSGNDSPTIENYSLDDLVNFYEGITQIQIYQPNFFGGNVRRRQT